MSVPKLIVMLTHHDVTAPDSKEIFLSAKDAPADCWGFKDVGLPVEEMKELVSIMNEAGKTTFMECLARTPEDTAKGIETALYCGFDILLGGHYFKESEIIAEKAGLRHLPFIGKREGGRLYGTMDEIVSDAVRVSKTSVAGINLSGYRYADGDPEELISKVISSIDKPLSIAGSVNGYERLDSVKRLNPWAFTIGGAFFEHVFGDTFAEQIKVVQDYLRT